MIRDNMKKEIASLLATCIQAPKTAKANALKGSGRSFGKQGPSSPWHSITDNLDNILETLQDNFVAPVLIQKLFSQVFCFINVQIFNSLLLRRECCSFSNGEYVKSGLDELELWCTQTRAEYAGSCFEELKHTKQAVGFLVIFQKYRLSYDDIASDLCPVLSVQQLYRICTHYWDDKYNSQSVSPDVLSTMKELISDDDSKEESTSFLLDDNSSIPFSIDDISSSVQEKEFRDVSPIPELLENPAFHFLQE